jgi:hypothetical protein
LLHAAVQVVDDHALFVTYDDGTKETYDDWNEMFQDLINAEDFSVAVTILKEDK